MFDAAVTVVKTDGDFATGKIVHESRSSRASAALQLIWLVPAVAVLALPFSLVLAERATLIAVAQDNPLAALNLALGLIVWAGLFGTPVVRLIARFGARRTVTIEHGAVTITERRLLGSTHETHRVADFKGIVHIVKTSLSGVHHDLMLVEKNARTGIVFHTAERIAPETIAKAAASLRLPVIAANDVVRFGRALAKPTLTVVPAKPATVTPPALPQAA
jgi:hypothetical protein